MVGQVTLIIFIVSFFVGFALLGYAKLVLNCNYVESFQAFTVGILISSALSLFIPVIYPDLFEDTFYKTLTTLGLLLAILVFASSSWNDIQNKRNIVQILAYVKSKDETTEGKENPKTKASQLKDSYTNFGVFILMLIGFALFISGAIVDTDGRIILTWGFPLILLGLIISLIIRQNHDREKIESRISQLEEQIKER
ncbi:hypothetical protein [Methanoculleus sp.]|jgi:hypothetical protein|uniref:hypothetical protein n=1 Tax=Methanoculleus sp. TaxID=90427 RepID=UPI001BD1DF7F|nr:hypothetical protein [Methanoculleus sp.]